jgi:hypothetical protein
MRAFLLDKSSESAYYLTCYEGALHQIRHSTPDQYDD